MEIIKQSSNELSKMDIYALTKSPEISKMKDAAGQVLEIAAWVEYKDVNKDGEEREILSIRTSDNDTLATNSRTFIEAFNDCIDIFGDDLKQIKVSTGTSRNGRTYLVCVAV